MNKCVFVVVIFRCVICTKKKYKNVMWLYYSRKSHIEIIEIIDTK